MAEVITTNLKNMNDELSLAYSSFEYLEEYGTYVSMQDKDEDKCRVLFDEILQKFVSINLLLDQVEQIVVDSYGN